MNFWFGDSANVIHVSKSGNDSNGGVAQQYPVDEAADAKLTIGSALSACPDGGTIVVWPGDYDETVDIATATKQITLIGTHPRLSNIKPTTGKGVIGYHGLTMKNISVEIQDDASIAVDCDTMDDLSFINCYVHTKGIDGIYCPGSNGVYVDNCFIFASFDSLLIGEINFVQNSTIITDGTSGSGAGVARAIAGGGATSSLIIRNSQLLAQAKYGDEKDSKAATLYECDRNLYCIDQTVNKVIAENCIFIADGSLPTVPHVDSYADSDVYCLKTVPFLVLRGCSLQGVTDANLSKTAYGISAGGQTVLNDCAFDIIGIANSYDLEATIARTVRLANCEYDTSQVHANITVEEAIAELDKVKRNTALNRGGH